MTQANLLFGVGAARSGTTWLHSYLAGHPDCHFRQIKELHYFDGLAGSGWRLAKLRKTLEGLQAGLASTKGGKREIHAQRISDYAEWIKCIQNDRVAQNGANHAAYLAYLNRDCGAKKIVGDMTPSYAMLSQAQFGEMAALAPNTRFLYLMRNPIDRLLSNIRLSAKRAARKGGDMAAITNARLGAFVAGDLAGSTARSDYAGTIRRLTAAVPRAHIHFEFFENLLTASGINRLTEFLGIAPKTAGLDKPVHQTEKVSTDPDLRKRATALLLPQYEFVAQFFQGQIPANWRASLAEVS